jgi:uncharacterized repeat protein (TIGR03803 family)
MAVAVFAGSSFAGDSAQVLYRFLGTSDGYSPYGNLISDQAGKLYGTTEYGGKSFYGEIFQLSPPAKAGLCGRRPLSTASTIPGTEHDRLTG